MAGNMLNLSIKKTETGKIAIVSIDQPGTSANVMTTGFFDELNSLIATISADTTIIGTIFTTAKKKVFLAGADLESMQEHVGNNKKLSQLIEYGQQTFNNIQDMTCITVSAIHGICLGGGLEFSLACDYRVASNDASTKIGLPEVMLGILPAWGGCTRLPRLIGVIKSLKFILSGTPKPSAVCKKLGIVDKIAYRENLVDEAIKLIQKPFKRKPITLWSPFNWLIFKKTKQITLSKTKGNYPAPLKIIDVISRGIKTTAHRSLDIEREAFIELVNTPESKNLIRIFFLQEASKKLKWKEHDTTGMHVEDVAVIGSGIMGSGICQWLSTRRIRVLLKDVGTKQIASGLKNISDLFIAGIHRKKFDRATVRNNIASIATTAKAVPLTNKDIIIEAISENVDIKTRALQEIESYAGVNTILATNTSALSVTSLGNQLQRPENFIGIHFFNPVHKMKLVEIVVGQQTSDETIARAVEFVKQIGKLPVIVKDSPGFLVNRILLPYLIQSMKLIEAGFSPTAIDRAAMKFGMPMGPLRLLDEIGLDVGVHVATDLSDRLKNLSLPSCIKTIMDSEYKGRKSGAGFYIYKKGKKLRENTSLINSIQRAVNSRTDVDIDMLIQVMVTEANKCLEEGIIQDGDMLDFAMIMGTGWAPFRGGPIQFSKS